MATVADLRYRDWRSFKSDFIVDLFGSSLFQPGRYLFRGQRSVDWTLEPSFDRWLRGVPTPAAGRVAVSEELAKMFARECQKLDVSSDILSDPVRFLAFAQHAGLPTRLLDWTESPYIAAWFAFSDALAQQDQKGTIAVWALHLESTAWGREVGVEVVCVPPGGNPRMRNQAGWFTVARTPQSCLEDHVRAVAGKDKALTRTAIPASEARAAMAELECMGINYSSIYPEPSGCALTAKTRMLLRLNGPD